MFDIQRRPCFLLDQHNSALRTPVEVIRQCKRGLQFDIGLETDRCTEAFVFDLVTVCSIVLE